MSAAPSLLIPDLLCAYRSGRTSAAQVMQDLQDRADRAEERHVWITRLSRAQVAGYVRAIEQRAIEELPLYGVPFLIKDNMDLAGVPTTAACPGFAYTPGESAAVVQKLLDAGAIPLGKTNLDQFATGLAGVRSPYGACRNSFNGNFIAGGSSAGSAVALATGLASFSLGTDTAGSGRVPAAFNNIVGLKPSLGRLSTRGVVPACRTLDCVSIFGLTAEDAERVLAVAQGFDALDPYSRRLGDRAIAGMRFGVPRREQLQFFGDGDYARLFEAAILRLESLGGTRVEVDLGPFLDAARLLYEGPWIAERYAAVGAFISANPDAVHPITRQIIGAGDRASAAALFQAQYQLMALKRSSEVVWSRVDLMLTPTAGTIYTLAEIEEEPIRRNSTLGYYTNFMNLLDLAGVAVPAGFRADGLPFGVTLIGPCASERSLLALGARLHRASVATLGALGAALPPLPAAAPAAPAAPAGFIALAVCGAHMEGLALNHQLRERGACLLQRTQTAPRYRLYVLPGGPPRRPGLVRVTSGGERIELEVWAMPPEHVGSFIAAIPAPLAIGTIELASGAQVSGFICEAYAAEDAADITALGGWRRFMAAGAES